MENIIHSKTQEANFRRIDAKHEDFIYSAELLQSIKEDISTKG
jgi:hypothetical protein